jgi:hypothetical protein
MFWASEALRKSSELPIFIDSAFSSSEEQLKGIEHIPWNIPLPLGLTQLFLSPRGYSSDPLFTATSPFFSLSMEPALPLSLHRHIVAFLPHRWLPYILVRPVCEAVHLSSSVGRRNRWWRESQSGFRPRSILYQWRRRRRTSQSTSTSSFLADLFLKQKENNIALLGSIPASCSSSAPLDHRSRGDL